MPKPNHELSPAVHSHRRFAYLLAVITGIAAILRFWQSTESLWLDETHTAWVVADGFGQIASRARAGNYGPVFFWFPWLATRIFGLNEFALRLPSLLAGIGLIPVCFLIAREWFRSPVLGLLAAALVAIDPHSLFYSLDARPYSLVQLLSAIHVWLLVAIIRHDKTSLRRRVPFADFKTLWTLYCVVGILLFQLHITSGLLFPAEALIVIAALVADASVFAASTKAATGYGLSKTDHRTRALWAMCGLVVISIGSLSAIGTVRHVASRRELWKQFIERQADFRVIFPWAEYLGTAALVALACWIFAKLKRKSDDIAKSDAMDRSHDFQDQREMLLWTLIWLLLPLGIAFVLTRLDIARLFYRRYAMFSYPALVLLSTGMGIMAPTRRGKALYSLILFSTVCFLLGPQRQFGEDRRLVRHSHEDWRGATHALRSAEPPPPFGDGFPVPIVLVRTGLVEEELAQTPDDIAAASEYLLFPVSSIYALPEFNVHLLSSDLQMSNVAIKRMNRAAECSLIIRGKKWFTLNRDKILESVSHRLKTLPDANQEVQYGLKVVFDGGNVILAKIGNRDPTTGTKLQGP